MIIKLKDGRFVIPKLIRKALGIEADSEIKIELQDDKLIVTKRTEN